VNVSFTGFVFSKESRPRTRAADRFRLFVALALVAELVWLRHEKENA